MKDGAVKGLAARLGRRRELARLALGWEAVWPRLWPVLGVLGLFVLLALLGLPPLLPGPWHLLLLLGFAIAIGGLAWHRFRGFRLPGEAAAERRLEEQSGLRHRPLAALADHPTGDDLAGLALWRAHQARAAAQISTLKVGAPRPGLPARDPVALRAALLVGLAAAFVMAGAEAPERLRRSLLPAFAATPAAPQPRLEAWVTPPAYTGAAPVFLNAAGGAATVPQGSRLQVAISGGAPMGVSTGVSTGTSAGVPELVTEAGTTPFRALDAASFTVEAVLESGGRLLVRRNGQELARWVLTVQADAPPTVAFSEPPARAQRGLGLRLPWRAEDDWGLTSLRAEFRLQARPDAAPHVLDLPLPRNAAGNAPRGARGTGQPDLSAHPWAGLDVAVRLFARDGAEQEGASDVAALTLPERSFVHPVAKRLIAVRKALSLDPLSRTPARRELEAVGAAPEAFEHDMATYLALRSARSRLGFDRRPEAVPEVQEMLWEIALALEEGRDARTARALAQAREALREALAEAERRQEAQREAQAEEQRQQAAPGTPEQREQAAQERQEQRNQERDQQQAELQRRIQELRDAIRQHLEALAERLQRENAEAMPADPQSRMMDQREIDRRTQRMQDAAREDRTEDAKRELAELEEMLRALEEGRVARQENPERQQRRERGQQQMGVVQDMVRRESEMLDRSHRRAEGEEQRRADARRQQQRQNSFRWPPEPPGQPPAQGGPSGNSQEPPEVQDREQDGRRQRALRRALGELMQQFGDLTGEVPEGLGRADQAMRDAQEALRPGGSGGDARDAQQRAIRALQEGGRQMAQSMQRQFGQGQPQEGEGEGEPQDQAGDGQPGGEGPEGGQQQGEGRDPLGRRSREVNGNADSGADTRVPEEAELLRTRRIQEELRRRGGEKARPVEELDYIDRLLKRF